MKHTVRLTESELKRMISESVKRVLNETRFGNPKEFEGRTINGKMGYLETENGDEIVLSQVHFDGDRIIGVKESGEQISLFISRGFAQPLNGSNIPFAQPTKDGVRIKNLHDINGNDYVLTVVD